MLSNNGTFIQYKNYLDLNCCSFQKADILNFCFALAMPVCQSVKTISMCKQKLS